MKCETLKIGLRQFDCFGITIVFKLTIKTEQATNYFVFDLNLDGSYEINGKLKLLIESLDIKVEFDDIIKYAITKSNSKYGINVYRKWPQI